MGAAWSSVTASAATLIFHLGYCWMMLKVNSLYNTSATLQTRKTLDPRDEV
jgi:hypothetical protein